MAELGLEHFARNRFDIKPTTKRLGTGVRMDHEAPVFEDFLNQILAAEIAEKGLVIRASGQLLRATVPLGIPGH